MSVLSRVAWIPQARVDLHHVLMMESFTAFDFRTIATLFAGAEGSYVVRGLEIVGKSGLSISIKVADSLVLSPLDGVAAFYAGLSDDPEISIILPSGQSNVYVEGKLVRQTQAPLNQAQWDPLATSGEDVSGNEFTASVNSQEVVVLEISANTIGFTEGAIKIGLFSTGPTSITSMKDRRQLLFRLGTAEDPLHKYDWATSRAEPVPSGLGVADEVDSPWRSKDSTGSLNDKALKSFKDWADAVMTRIAEISGTSIWYQSGVSVLPISGLSVSSLFFDSIGHSIQPSPTSSFTWKKVSGSLRLAGEGNVPLDPSTTAYEVGLVRWKFNYGNLEWHLGHTFTTNRRGYTDVRFISPAVPDGDNVYLHLEREVPKGSGQAVKWADNSSHGTFNVAKAVSGVAGDFVGIAIGDYVRKESEGFARYYRVAKLGDGSTTYGNLATEQNWIADSTITALELEDAIIGGASTEPLRYFRSRYESADLIVGTYNNTDYYWLGRRVGDLFILRDYGTLQENEEVTTLNDSFISGSSGSGDLTVEHALGARYTDTAGWGLISGTGTLIKIRRRKRDNTTKHPGPTSNAGAFIEYTIDTSTWPPPSSSVLSAGDSIWVRLSDSSGGSLTYGSVTNVTDDLNNTDATTNKWEIISAANIPLRIYDNKDIYLLARRIVTSAGPALQFFDGTIISRYGRLLDNHVEVAGDFRLKDRPNEAILFIDQTTTGRVSTDVTYLSYIAGATGSATIRNFLVENHQISLASNLPISDVNFLTNLGANELVIGGTASTIRIPGDLIVQGNTISAQVSQLFTEDKVITLGIGNISNGGSGSGIEVADDTKTATAVSFTSGSSILTITITQSYVVGDQIGIDASVDVGGITAGQQSGVYTLVSGPPTAPGEARAVSGTTLEIYTNGTATSTGSTASNIRSFKMPSWIRMTNAGGALTGMTSWGFKVKAVATVPTITPHAGYGIVPTAHSTNMLASRIPFVNDDNVGPGGVDSTLDFSGNLTWSNTTSTLTTTNLTINSVASFAGSMRWAVKNVNISHAPYTVAASDISVFVDSTGATTGYVVNLPLISSSIHGRIVIVKDATGVSNETGKQIIVTATSPNTIDGSTTQEISNDYASLTLQADNETGTWRII